ncbi:hypothetical protein VMCG_02847 [Cytospora schulzeri]|uniref:WW domain-containing protein n=1 Tax=Cytospora schulzeri TaxID=448051 RepID=A0A423WZP3_9PEZI|nr:hypothetical protein VMCG_02847 [Valsa malicola]
MTYQQIEIPSLSYHDYFIWPGPKEIKYWDLMRHPRNNRVMWQHNENGTVRWTDPLIPHRWWSQWTDGEGQPFWLNDFTQETATEEPLNANWSITLRNSYGCNDDAAIIGVINHPIVNGCYPLDGHGMFNFGSPDDEDSFRYKGSFTVYPGPCKIRVFQTAGCPTEDVAWLTHDPSKKWQRAGRWASVKPEEGAKCFKINEAQYAFDNTSGTMSVPVEWRRRFCHGDPELDEPRLPQAPEWPGGLGDDIKDLMNVRWNRWLDKQWQLGVDKDSDFASWMVKEVGCRRNAESAVIQKRLSRPFAPSVQVMCPQDDVSQWWMRDREP